jgi:hypothetical protein
MWIASSSSQWRKRVNVWITSSLKLLVITEEIVIYFNKKTYFVIASRLRRGNPEIKKSTKQYRKIQTCELSIPNLSYFIFFNRNILL